MKAGYCRVSPNSANTAAGKIRKIRCKCTNPEVYLITAGKTQYFNNNETGFPYKYHEISKGLLSDQCPVCETFAWYTI